MPSILITNVLQAVALYFLRDEIPDYLWWTFVVIYVFLFLGARAYYNTSETDGADVLRFWYLARSYIFMFNIVSILVMYGYLFLT